MCITLPPECFNLHKFLQTSFNSEDLSSIRISSFHCRNLSETHVINLFSRNLRQYLRNFDLFYANICVNSGVYKFLKGCYNLRQCLPNPLRLWLWSVWPENWIKFRLIFGKKSGQKCQDIYLKAQFKAPNIHIKLLLKPYNKPRVETAGLGENQ